jgi:hypothetical protein
MSAQSYSEKYIHNFLGSLGLDPENLAPEPYLTLLLNCFFYHIAQYHANVALAEEEQSFYVTIDSKEKSQYHTSVLIFLARRHHYQVWIL